MSWIGDVAPCLAKDPEPHRGLPPSLNAWIPVSPPARRAACTEARAAIAAALTCAAQELMDLSEMPGLAAAQELARGILGGAAQGGPAQKSAHHRRSSGQNTEHEKWQGMFLCVRKVPREERSAHDASYMII